MLKKLIPIFALFLVFVQTKAVSHSIQNTSDTRKLLSVPCDSQANMNPGYRSYFQAMKAIYKQHEEGTCLTQHTKCGWPSSAASNPKLPIFVLSIGLEGAGHHLWTELLEQPVFDCVWINGRHYNREVADGVPRTTAMKLAEGFKEQFAMRAATGKPPCNSIYDAEDSFPTGSIRKAGRIFMRPDLVNLEMLDGILFNVKYLLIARNVTV